MNVKAEILKIGNRWNEDSVCFKINLALIRFWFDTRENWNHDEEREENRHVFDDILRLTKKLTEDATCDQVGYHEKVG